MGLSSMLTTPAPYPPQSQHRASRPWHHWKSFLLTAACVCLYAPVLTLLAQEWWYDPEATHGIFVALLTLYVVWERRHQFAHATVVPNHWGLPVFLGGLGCLILGSLGAELFLMGISLPITLTGLILYLFGHHHLRLLAFPLGFAPMMVPLPSTVVKALTLPLQLLAARLGTWLLELLALPVYREGTIIFFPHSALEILEACSGIRSLVALIALAVILAYVRRSQVWQAMLLVVLAIPITLATNALRIWGTGIVAHRYGTDAAEGFYHVFGGWAVFGVSLTMLVTTSLFLSHDWFRVSPSEAI